MRMWIVAGVLLISSAARASQPGTPIDCTDFVPGEPGKTCRLFLARTFNPGQPPISPPSFDYMSTGIFSVGDNDRAIDNEGNLYRTAPACYGQPAQGVRVIRITGVAPVGGDDPMGTESIVGAIPDRCAKTISSRRDLIWFPTINDTQDSARIAFDGIQGRLRISLVSYSTTRQSAQRDYYDVRWIAAIEGFPTLADVLRQRPRTSSEAAPGSIDNERTLDPGKPGPGKP